MALWKRDAKQSQTKETKLENLYFSKILFKITSYMLAIQSSLNISGY